MQYYICLLAEPLGLNCSYLDAAVNENYLGWGPGGIGRMLIFMSIQSVVLFALLGLIESGLIRRFWYFVTKPRKQRPVLTRLDSIVQEDDDVADERRRINTTPLSTLQASDSLILQELTKHYGSLLAVDKLSLGITHGDCFGLLGINGAGKTSTFKMLTGDETVTSGNAYLDGFSIKTNIRDVSSKY